MYVLWNKKTSADSPLQNRLDLHRLEHFSTENDSKEEIKIIAFNQSLKFYLIPINKIFYLSNITNDSFTEEMLRSGVGLEPFTTEKNESIWVENGVQYRPFPFLEEANNSFYSSEFEAYVPFDKLSFFENDERKLALDTSQKKIILWWQHKLSQTPIKGLNPLRACPDFPCVLTSDRVFTKNSSAMLINAQFVNNENPPERRPDQVLINYQIESPSHYWFYGNLFNKVAWNEAFNWTMSYRMDADITTFYGIIRRRRNVTGKNYREIVSAKRGLVAWLVSNCDAGSKRMAYVYELKKYIPVDIFGHCGTFKCPRDVEKDCLHLISTKYKFYLSFESNFCKDYLTEKLYKYLNHDIIVITRGYNTYSQILPSEIFLNTAKFKTPKMLAEKILHLDSHEEEYVTMLKLKDQYFAVYEDYPLTRFPPVYLEHRYEAVPMCLLCQRLWNLNKYSRVIQDMSAWFHNKDFDCYSPSDIILQ